MKTGLKRICFESQVGHHDLDVTSGFEFVRREIVDAKAGFQLIAATAGSRIEIDFAISIRPDSAIISYPLPKELMSLLVELGFHVDFTTFVPEPIARFEPETLEALEERISKIEAEKRRKHFDSGLS
jgi:hypothetical protein